MSEILEIKRREPYWPQLGQLLAQPFAQKQAQEQSMYSTLMPLIFKAQLERQNKMNELELEHQYEMRKIRDFKNLNKDANVRAKLQGGKIVLESLDKKQEAEEGAIERRSQLGKMLPYIEAAGRLGKPSSVFGAALPTYSTPEEQKQIFDRYGAGRKIFEQRGKKSPLIMKKELDTAELGKNATKLIDLFRSAQSEGRAFDESFGQAGPQSRVSGIIANLSGKFGSSKLPNLNVYNREAKAFATTVAKAAGEVRPTDQDIKRFMGTLPATTLSDQENEIIINQLIQDMKNKGYKGLWKERTGSGGRTKSGLTYTIEK